MADRVSNVDSDSETKVKAMNYILREICTKYKNKRDPTFSREEVHERLLGLGPEYINLNIRDLFRGSGLIEIDKYLSLRLNNNGIRYCMNERF